MTIQKYMGYLNKSPEKVSSTGKQLSPDWQDKEINPGNHNFLEQKLISRTRKGTVELQLMNC
jgi:hypothetical protein